MRILLFIFISILSVSVNAQIKFNDYFEDKVLRFDFMLAGNKDHTKVFPAGMKEEPFFAGSKNNLADPFSYGNFRYELFDADNRLLYSRGFSSLYQEWLTTPEAEKKERSFYEVVTMPFPKKRVRFVLSMRERTGVFSELYSTEIDPADYFIIREKPSDTGYSVICKGGDPENSIDIAFIAEGYTSGEMDKFRSDVRKISDVLLSESPFDNYKDRFNIWAVEAISGESGTDVPGEGIYVNTALNSSFYTFGLDRYLATQDIKTVNDYAAVVPHDNIIILINTSRYGGNGVFNYYSDVSSDHILTRHIFLHEFGHCFAGLADEYYTSDVPYEEYYPLNVEPWEPNITTLKDFEAKWKKLIPASVPVPTPPEEQYKSVTGLFEGGGYSEKGIYRPAFDCRMKSNTDKGFCEICRKAIVEMIKFYTE